MFAKPLHKAVYNSSKQFFFFFFLAICVSLCLAANDWTDAAADGNPFYSDFLEPANWSLGNPANQSCRIFTPNLGSPVIGGDITVQQLIIGDNNDLGSCQVFVYSGGEISTQTDGHFYIGQNTNGNGIFNITGGKAYAAGKGRFVVGNKGTGTLNISNTGRGEAFVILAGNQSGSHGCINISEGGYLHCRDWSAIGYNGHGTLHMTGGVYYSENARLIVAPWWVTPQSGHVQLDGGVIDVPNFEIGPAGEGNIGTMDVKNGKLIVREFDRVAYLKAVAAEGRISAFGGDGELNIVWDGSDTIVDARQYLPQQAHLPIPAIGEAVKNTSLTLEFTPGTGAVSHDIYLGTDFDAVSSAARGVGDIDGDGRTDPADIAAIAAQWLSGTAAEPADLNSDGSINLKDISIFAANWKQSAAGEFKGNTTAAGWSTGELASGTTYYWRVDEISPSGITKGLVWEFTTPLPPGTWHVSPDTLISGQNTDIRLIYTNGSEALPAGSLHHVLIEPLSVQSLFHCKPSVDYEIVPHIGTLPNIVLHQEPTNGVGFTEVTFTFPDGLAAGDSFAMKMGNSGAGGIIGLVNPVPVHSLTFETYSDFGDGEVSWLSKGWAGSLGRVDIEPAAAAAMRLFLPSLVETSSEFRLRLSVTDMFDSAANPAFAGTITLSSNGLTGLPTDVTCTPADNNSIVISGLSAAAEGIYRISASILGIGTFESNPCVVRDIVERPIYWGNIHNHGCYSEDWGDDMDNFYSFARDISGMDYVAASDHTATTPTLTANGSRLLMWRLNRHVSRLEAWLDTIETANRYNQPSDFVTLVGYENGFEDAGHYNVYYENPTAENMSDIYTDTRVDIDTFRSYIAAKDVLCIPHKHAAYFEYSLLDDTIVNSAGKQLTPVIEVYSDWGGSFSPYGTWNTESLFGGLRSVSGKSYQWAVENGYDIGLISDSDSHTGLPGRRNPGGIAPNHDHPQGITAAMTNDYSRRGIMDCYHDKHTYGTTGERIFIDARINGAIPGDTLNVSGPFEFNVEIAATDLIDYIDLYRGLTLIERKYVGISRDITTTFNCPAVTGNKLPYMIMAVLKDENRAWTTPIWVNAN
ncbi:hypothetical protein SMSP2_00262 [Limihaloglobus sulfuriphilus]|uniref:DUF3604 domain-containing protein n=1 Tax=Limihaloglobus sulfuriphilus TaxID=1851148 RepID=A0A1Q2MBL8_9BACT|nr:hypothetical protein SMSP2_00262 [Limihaloglobus sulfuriphilus]